MYWSMPSRAQSCPHGAWHRIGARLMKAIFYEDLNVGDEWKSPGRSITDADIVNFSGLSGDYNAAHTDEVYASKSPLGRRILHGVAGLAFATGLEQRIGLKDAGGALLLLGVNWDFKAPIFIGDTIYVEEKVASKRVSAKDPTRGIVKFSVALINQNEDVTQVGEWSVMYRLRPNRLET